LINLPFCLDNVILVGFLGSLALCQLSAISKRHDEALICLTQREVNNQNSSMESAREAGLVLRLNQSMVVRVQASTAMEGADSSVAFLALPDTGW
jgi:hypothetical protein